MIYHSKATRCPVCAGAKEDPRGKGIRCWGYTSDDRRWAHCTRENFAGSIPIDDNSQAFVHKIGGACNCGVTHISEQNGSQSKIILATYEYHDEQDEPLYRVLRYLPKTFSQERWDKKACKWITGKGILDGVRRVLYRLPDILHAEGPILIVEGEKDAETGWALGFPSTTGAGGAGKWSISYNAALKDRDIIIIPDKDEKGRSHAADVAASLKGYANSIRILELHGDGKDLSAWVEAGGNTEMLTQLIIQGPDWESKFKAKRVKASELLPLIDEPIPYIVKPVIVRSSLTQIQGIPKGGKSAFSLYLSLCCSTGTWPFPQYLASEHGPLNVLYIAWEDPKIMMAKRLSLYGIGLGFGKIFLPERLTFLFGPEIFIEREDYAAHLIAAIKELKADVVFIDTLSQVHLCDENEASQMKIPMAGLRRVAEETNAGIVYIHHTVKGNGHDKAIQDKGRGSGSIAAAWHILLDWGQRSNGSNVNPVIFQSKYEHEWKEWAIKYEAQKNEVGNVESVKWIIDSADPNERPKKKRDIKSEKILETVKKLATQRPERWVTANEVQYACGLDVEQKTVKRYLAEFVEGGIVELKMGLPGQSGRTEPNQYRILEREK